MDFNPNNFTFEIESVSFQMVHGKLSTIDDLVECDYTEGADDPADDIIYLLARAYAELLTKVD